MSVILYPCIVCVALLMDLFGLCAACLTVFVNCLVKKFAICLGVVAILLLNVMEVFSVGGGALLIDHVWSSKEYACCACDSNVHVSVHSIGIIYDFDVLMLSLYVILHTMWSGKSLQLLCIFPFGMLCLSAISIMLVHIMLAVSINYHV